jgi:hypothetical protein
MIHTLKAPESKCLKLGYEDLLSTLGFNVNLRRYSPVPTEMEFTLPSMPKSLVTVYMKFEEPGSDYLLMERGDIKLAGTGTETQYFVQWEPAKWDEKRTVQVKRNTDDLTDSGPRSTKISYTVLSEDASYSGLKVGPTAVTAVDDDKAGVVMTPSTGFSLTEGGASSEAGAHTLSHFRST